MSPTVDRKFWLILGFSALLHASLFVLTAWHRQPHAAPLPAILASIRLVEAPAAAGAAPAPAAHESGKVAPRPAPATLPPKARQASPSPSPAAVVSSHLPAGPAIAPAPATPANPTAAAVSEPASVATAPAPVPRPAPDLLDGYKARLAGLFAARHEYPRVAAMRGWEGEVRLRLKIARKGNLLGVALDRSSGHDVLDQHALALLAGYGDLPPLPEALELGEIQVIVPINYKLRKTT